MSKYEVKVFVQTTEIYIVEADDEAGAVDVAVDRFGNGDAADVPCGDARVVDTDVEKFVAESEVVS